MDLEKKKKKRKEWRVTRVSLSVKEREMCRYICCIEVNVYAHACEGVGEEEDMENREILRRRAGRTRAGTR